MIEIGSSLREARRRRNLELAEVEQATRIRIQQLEALEHERFELLPPDPYRRSFLCEYAHFLGLDEDLYADEYDLRFRPPPEPTSAPPPRPRVGRARPISGRGLLRAGAILLIVLVGVAAWQLGGPGNRTVTPPAATTRTQTHTQTHTPAHTHAASTPAAVTMLVLSATRGSCWLWVRAGSSNGQTIYEQTLQPGQRVRFGLRRPLWIRIGAPWNLDATIRHRPLALPATTGDVLATAAGIRPAP